MPDFSRVLDHPDPGRFERLHFFGRRTLTAGNDRAGMTHAASRRRSDAGDETDYRFFDVLLDEFRCLFLRITPEILQASRKVREQMKIIMENNRDLMNEQGMWIDAMGMNAARLLEFIGPDGTPYMDNIVLEKGTDTVRIIDTGLFTLSPKHYLQYLLQCENARRFGLSFEGQ